MTKSKRYNVSPAKSSRKKSSLLNSKGGKMSKRKVFKYTGKKYSKKGGHLKRKKQTKKAQHKKNRKNKYILKGGADLKDALEGLKDKKIEYTYKTADDYFKARRREQEFSRGGAGKDNSLNLGSKYKSFVFYDEAEITPGDSMNAVQAAFNSKIEEMKNKADNINFKEDTLTGIKKQTTKISQGSAIDHLEELRDDLNNRMEAIKDILEILEDVEPHQFIDNLQEEKKLAVRCECLKYTITHNNITELKKQFENFNEVFIYLLKEIIDPTLDDNNYDTEFTHPVHNTPYKEKLAAASLFFRQVNNMFTQTQVENKNVQRFLTLLIQSKTKEEIKRQSFIARMISKLRRKNE